jgi:hypothetical protein
VQRSRIAKLDGRPSILDRRLDLAAMADEPGVAQEPLDVAVAETGDCIRLEAANALRKFSRLRRIVSQESPDWKPRGRGARRRRPLR